MKRESNAISFLGDMDKNMKKLVMVVLLLVSFPIAAAGVYAGIWAAQYKNVDIGYLSIHENNGQMVLIVLQEEQLTWGASSGTRNGNRASLKTVVGNLQASTDTVFTSPVTLEITQTSCFSIKPGVICTLQNGEMITATKIF